MKDKRAPTETPHRLLRTAEAAVYLDCEPRTLEAKRQHGGGPPFIRISSRAVRYRLADLDAWLDSRQCRSTAEAAITEPPRTRRRGDVQAA